MNSKEIEEVLLRSFDPGAEKARWRTPARIATDCGLSLAEDRRSKLIFLGKLLRRHFGQPCGSKQGTIYKMPLPRNAQQAAPVPSVGVHYLLSGRQTAEGAMNTEETCARSPYVCTEPDVSPLVRAMMDAWFEVADYEDEYQNDPAEKVVGWNNLAPARYRICTWFTGYGECQTAEQYEYRHSVPW